MIEQLIGPILEFFVGLWAKNPVLYTFLGLVVILTPIMRLPGVKGWMGETTMRLGFKLFLPKDTYRVLNNVTIPDGQGGTTQIDHVIVSPYGVFVVETKHYKGWIFGGEHDSQWTQKIHGNHSQKFQNPLRQNYKHTECLRELLGLTRDQVTSVAVFTGDCTLKTRDKLPAHVTYPGSCVRYIKRQGQVIFDVETVTTLECAIRENRLTPGWKTARAHVAYVKELHQPEAKSSASPVQLLSAPIPEVAAESAMRCPKCGAEMILRTAKRGANAGDRFWGCSNYPKCRQIMPAAVAILDGSPHHAEVVPMQGRSHRLKDRAEKTPAR